MTVSSGTAPSESRRVLGLRDLVVYGIVLIQPIAPVGIFGIACQMAGGHVVTTILIAMCAMMLTAWSYGRLAALYPSAGSAYTYVGRAFNQRLGFVVGWAMFLDYLIIPVINTIYGALAVGRLVPEVPYWAWALLFALILTGLNLCGISSLSRANQALLAVMTVVIVAFVVLALRYLFHSAGWSGVFSTQPFYDPRTFHPRAVMAATSLAALTYIGFDGVTTLAEEVRNPRRTVPLATVLVCLLTGLFSAVEVYLGQRVSPNYQAFANPETAFMDVTRIVGGQWLFQSMGLVLVLACVGSGLAGIASAARLLFTMGREDMLPRRLFGRLGVNVVLIGVVALAGALAVSYEQTAELLNFGAFLAFMGVNLAAMKTFWFRADSRRRLTSDALAPAFGFLFCFAIWWSLPLPARIAGGVWLALGVFQVMATGRWKVASNV
ncbi:MAG TPA: APC family permease [Bryobacteraceae bacterium]|nr:APC family permease [Bryobacteraceae bacterium]